MACYVCMLCHFLGELAYFFTGRVGQNHIYTRCMYVIFGSEITNHKVMRCIYIYGSGQP